MDKKTLPRYKSSKYYARFEVEWVEGKSLFHLDDQELILLFKKNGELTPESKVGIENKYSHIFSEKQKAIYWKRKTKEGKEKIALGEIKPDEDFHHFLKKFFREWHGGYRKTTYCMIKAICDLYREDRDKFLEMAEKANNLDEFISLMGIR